MKTNKVFLVVLVMGLLAVLFATSQKQQASWLPGNPAGSPRGSTEQTTFFIQGAGTVEAEPRAERALEEVPGVLEAKVSYPRRTAVVSYDPDKVEIQQLMGALESVGFKASQAQAKYICPTCQGTYHSAGACLICDASLKPIKK